MVPIVTSCDSLDKLNIDFVLDIITLAIKLKIEELNFHVATYNGRAKFVEEAGIVSPTEWYSTYQSIRNYVKNTDIKNLKLRIPPRYCKKNELKKLFSNHKCTAFSGDRMLIVPQDKTKGDLGGPLYACGLLIGEQATLGWNKKGSFVFNKSNAGEFANYYAEDIPLVNMIPVCPIVSNDSYNLNYLDNGNLVPLCISYKPPLI